MSASCQSINSMFKVRPIRTCAKFEPVKESEAQIPSVELITELVKVELQELCFYVMYVSSMLLLALLMAMCTQGRTFPTLFLSSATTAWWEVVTPSFSRAA